VKILEYRPRVLHAKTIVIDDDWASVGRANVDYRSPFINDELNAVFGPGPEVAELGRQFEADCAESEQVRIKPWRRRPWTMLVAEAIGWFVRRWL
jgi:cardiolipin synthase A/B